MRRNNSRLWVVGLALAFFGCEGLTNLDVINENNPETQRALESPEDVEALIGGTFLTYWDGTQHSSPFAALSTAFEEGTSSWGNFGMRDYSSEPRVVYNNSSSYGNRGTNNTPWNAMYAALSSTSDGITAINEGLKIGIDGGDNTRALAYAKFVQGLSLGWLALEFDKAIIFDEDVDLAAAAAGEFEFEPYTAVMTAALVKLDAAIANLSFTTNLHDLMDVDLVIEAVPEDLNLQKKVWAEADGVVQAQAVFATNTSGLVIGEINQAVSESRRPQFIGAHWFSPAPVMKLVELVHAPETAEETLQALESVCQRIGKASVRVKDAPGKYGFIANRVYFAAVREAQAVMAEGIASAEDINKAMVQGYNWPIGPLAMVEGARKGWQ